MAIFNLIPVTGIQFRRSMEETFRSQIDGVLAAMKELVSHNVDFPIVGMPDAIQAGSH